MSAHRDLLLAIGTLSGAHATPLQAVPSLPTFLLTSMHIQLPSHLHCSPNNAFVILHLSPPQEKKPYNGQLEPMLLQHVVPLFESPHGHLR